MAEDKNSSSNNNSANSTVNEQSGAVGAQNNLGGHSGQSAGEGSGDRESRQGAAGTVVPGAADQAFGSSIGGLPPQGNDSGVGLEGGEADMDANHNGEPEARNELGVGSKKS